MSFITTSIAIITMTDGDNCCQGYHRTVLDIVPRELKTVYKNLHMNMHISGVHTPEWK